MKIVGSRVRCCIEESYFIDKKMRKRIYKQKRYMVPLTDDVPFQENEEVKIMGNHDFETVRMLCAKLRDDKEILKKQLEGLTKSLEEQKSYITHLEKNASRKENTSKLFFSKFSQLLRVLF